MSFIWRGDIKQSHFSSVTLLSHNVVIRSNMALLSPAGESQRCTLPTMLYLLLKNVYQSSSTFLSLSPRSSQSGRQSSILSEDCAKAREASLPANTIQIRNHPARDLCSENAEVCRADTALSASRSEHTMVRTLWRICLVGSNVENGTLDCYICRIALAGPYSVGSISSCSPELRTTGWSTITFC